METPAGWYDDGSGRQRWWDGQQWTDRYADADAPTQAPVPDMAAPGGAAPGLATPFGSAVAAAPIGTPSAAPRKPHVLGIIALAVAVAGFIFACIPGALIVGWVLLPIAFILSIVALFLKGLKWPAIVGLILSIIGTIVGFVVFFAVVATAAHDAFGDSGSAPAPTSATSTAPKPAESAAAPTADGKYAVTIDSATQTQDYQGKPALVVNYTFTNNSAKDVSFLFAVHAQAFQDGVELDSAIVSDGSVDTTGTLKEVKPGATVTVQWAYTLSSTSEVSVEVKELLSLDDTTLATKSFAVS